MIQRVTKQSKTKDEGRKEIASVARVIATKTSYRLVVMFYRVEEMLKIGAFI